MADEVTEDGFLDSRLRLRQWRRGYRAGLDAALLAAATDPPPASDVFEPGCGVGAASLALAHRRADVRVLGVEIDPPTASLAVENAALNGLGARVEFRCGDALANGHGVFDAVLLNPPYADPAQGRAPEDERRRLAFVDPNGVDRWVRVCADRLRGGARLTLIHRADALQAILAALDGRLGGIEIAPVFPRDGEPAHRVLVRAVKGSRAPVRIWRGLVLHGGDGGFTPQAEAIFRGRATFEWR